MELYWVLAHSLRWPGLRHSEKYGDLCAFEAKVATKDDPKSPDAKASKIEAMVVCQPKITPFATFTFQETGEILFGKSFQGQVVVDGLRSVRNSARFSPSA